MNDSTLEQGAPERINLDALHVRAIGDLLRLLGENVPSNSNETVDLEANTLSEIGNELYRIGERRRDDIRQIMDEERPKEGQGNE